MKKINISRCLLLIISAVLFYIIVISITFVDDYLFSARLWKSISQTNVIILNNKVSCMHMLHFMGGLLIYLYGINLTLTTMKVNKAAQDKVSRKPNKLIEDDVYSKRRHPMYTGFICVHVGMWFASCSHVGLLIGFIIITAISINSIIEEKVELEKIFQEDYILYKRNVPKRIFSKPLIIIFIFILIVYIMGYIF